MTTLTRETTATLPLYNGDRMNQVEFHRRYESYPDDVKIELIGGIVYFASPLRWPHGTATPKVSFLLTYYKMNTPGVEVGENMTVILGEESEPQPDLLLRVLPECGGQTRVDEHQYLAGAPELVVEVAHSSRAIDLGGKRRDYVAAGVQEYLVYSLEEEQIHWFHFPSRRQLRTDRKGIWKSRIFPGLWLDGPALVARDSARLLATLQHGLVTPEHASFVQLLQSRRPR